MSLGETGKQPASPGGRSQQETGVEGIGERDGALSRPDVDGLVSTALSLATRRLYPDAAALLKVAHRLRGSDSQLRMLMHEVEALADVQPVREGQGATQETARRNSIDAAHFLGLAALYSDRGKTAEALECIEMSKQKAPALPYAYKLHGRLLWRMQRYEAAAAELERAKRYNPFDAEVAELLGLVAYETGEFDDALGHTVDAFLLLEEQAEKAAARLRRRIRRLRKLLDWENERFVELFHERHRVLNTAYDRMQWRRDQFLVERGLLDRGLLFASGRSQEEASNRIVLAGKLREVPQLSHLSDEAVFQLTAVSREESKAANITLFPQSSSLRDLYLLERGEVEIKRRTPYGDFSRSVLRGRDLLGAVNYVDGKGRPAEATTRSVCQVVRLDADGLDRLVDSQPDLGVQLHTSLWHVLAARLRSNNRQMETFVPDQGGAPLDPMATATGSATHVPRDDKVRLFKEQGLSSRELLQLATFSTERHYPPETFLFREGDPGEEMFFVVDGGVRISRFIRGVGEEALAILGRGEFFGEMSLIDGEPRSADARTHAGPATVLTLHREAVTQALAMDPGAALSFLRLLNRILAARLRELEEKLILWHILTMQQ